LKEFAMSKAANLIGFVVCTLVVAMSTIRAGASQVTGTGIGATNHASTRAPIASSSSSTATKAKQVPVAASGTGK